MRFSLNHGMILLNAIALSGLLAVITGCGTTTPEPTFADVEPGASTNSANIATLGPLDTPPSTPPDTQPREGAAEVLHIGDAIVVTVTGIGSKAIEPHEERIKDDGSINLYLVGKVQAAGRSPGDLQRDLQTRYETYFKNPVVTVNAATRFYYVGGEVKRPGPQAYLGEATVTKAIQAAGDFTDFAKKTNIRVIRADDTSLKVNFNKAIKEPSLDPPIYPGDKIYVPRRHLW